MADLSWGHINIMGHKRSLFRGYTRGICSQSTQRTNKSLFVFVCMTTQSWLRLAACKIMQNSRNTYIHINKIYLHSRQYFTSKNCIFTQFQGIVFIQLQGNDILVNCKGNKLMQRTYIVFIHKKYNHSRQLYSFTELYSFQGTYQFIQGNHIHSRKYLPSMKTYSFREIISI